MINGTLQESAGLMYTARKSLMITNTSNNVDFEDEFKDLAENVLSMFLKAYIAANQNK